MNTMYNIHSKIKKKIDIYIENNKIPNILLHGESGCGKKTILKYLMNKLYTTKEDKHKYIMYVNCGHGKGIKFIREDLKFFSKMNIDNKNGKRIKSVILLNTDQLTIDAQSALRRCIELFSTNTRFFMVVEKINTILKPIISRFSCIHVPLPKIKNKITNLHSYSRNFNYKLNKNLLNIIKNEFDGLDIISSKNNQTYILNLVQYLYDNSINGIDIINFINDTLEDSIKKYEILVYFEMLIKEIRCEKTIMFLIINVYIMRNNFKLENIDIL